MWNGRGIYHYPNRNGRYEGDFVNSQKHGKGTMYYSNGDIVCGDWKQDICNGKCIFAFANGNQYEGDFIIEKPHGYGSMKYANGDKFEGNWKLGYKHGEGNFTPAGGQICDGIWFNDMKKGDTIIEKKCDTKQYANRDLNEKDCKNDLRNGSSISKSANGIKKQFRFHKVTELKNEKYNNLK